MKSRRPSRLVRPLLYHGLVGAVIIGILSVVNWLFLEKEGGLLVNNGAFSSESISTLLHVSKGLIGLTFGLFTSSAVGFVSGHFFNASRYPNEGLAGSVSLGFSTYLFKTISYLYSRQNREQLEIVIADLSKDVRDMRKEGRSGWFIRFIVFWHTGGTVLAVSKDGFKRLVSAVRTIIK